MDVRGGGPAAEDCRVIKVGGASHSAAVLVAQADITGVAHLCMLCSDMLDAAAWRCPVTSSHQPQAAGKPVCMSFSFTSNLNLYDSPNIAVKPSLLPFRTGTSPMVKMTPSPAPWTSRGCPTSAARGSGSRPPCARTRRWVLSLSVLGLGSHHCRCRECCQLLLCCWTGLAASRAAVWHAAPERTLWLAVLLMPTLGGTLVCFTSQRVPGVSRPDPHLAATLVLSWTQEAWAVGAGLCTCLQPPCRTGWQLCEGHLPFEGWEARADLCVCCLNRRA